MKCAPFRDHARCDKKPMLPRGPFFIVFPSLLFHMNFLKCGSNSLDRNMFLNFVSSNINKRKFDQLTNRLNQFLEHLRQVESASRLITQFHILSLNEVALPSAYK